MTTEELNQYNQLSKAIIGAAIEVHKELGPGLLESVYEVCLVKELKDLGFKATPQVDIPLYYKGEVLDKKFRIDILVEDKVIIELKSTEKLLPIHEV